MNPVMIKNMSQRSLMSNPRFSMNISDYSQNEDFAIDIEKIFRGEETRTSIMVRNIPCRYTKNEIKKDFEQDHMNHFNDLRLPMDRVTPKTNLAYCFLNMRHPIFVADFIHDKNNYRWPKYSSDKAIAFTFAMEQPAMTMSMANLKNPYMTE